MYIYIYIYTYSILYVVYYICMITYVIMLSVHMIIILYIGELLRAPGLRARGEGDPGEVRAPEAGQFI